MEAEEVEQRLEALSLRIEGVDQTVTMLVNILDDYAKQMRTVADLAVVAEMAKRWSHTSPGSGVEPFLGDDSLDEGGYTGSALDGPENGATGVWEDMMDPRVSAMLRRQAEEEMILAQDRNRTADRALSTFDGWLRHGVAVGFCTHLACVTHAKEDIYTNDEAEQFEAGDDPCVVMVRIFPDGPGG